MKRIIITIVLAIVTVSLNAKELTRSNNNILDYTSNLVSVMSPTGVVPLGNLKEARNLMVKIDVTFSKHTLEFGEPDFRVGEDKDGLYVIRVGIGGVKIRPDDATKFLVVLEKMIVKDKLEDGKEIVGNAGKELWKVMKK